MNFELKNRLVVPEKAVSLHRLKKKDTLWRDGRVIDCSGLENRRTARYRGFESLSLRFEQLRDLFGSLFLCPNVNR